LSRALAPRPGILGRIPAFVAAVALAGCEARAPAPEDPGLDTALFAAVWDLRGPERVPEPDTVPYVDPRLLERELRGRLDAGVASGGVRVAGERLRAEEAVLSFYHGRLHGPAWVGPAGVSVEGRALAAILRQADRDGLRPEDYRVGALDSLFTAPRGDGEGEVGRRVDVELLLTDGFLLFGAHLLFGKLDPVLVEPTWIVEREGIDMVEVLERALAGEGVRGALYTLRPRSPGYERLRRTFVRYRELAGEGGWGAVPSGETLDPGASDPRVPSLRARLRASGDLPDDSADAADPESYDEALERGVRRFQARHGLEEDGRVGRGTTAALNVPVEARIRQLEVNLERRRWLPRDLGERHVLVNIPGFWVSVVEEGEEAMRLRAIVGRTDRQTPVFSATMTYLALAPYWNVPPGIAANDKLPEIRRDPGAVARQRMVLFDAATGRPVDPHSVDWVGMTGAEFNRRFRLRQEPGPQNALGGVKFMFPNRHNVYLHDTPGRELFDRAVRGFSSGCIRVERALDLAAHLLRYDPQWTPERIRRVIGQGREHAVTLPEPYRVHVQYWTAWVEEDGTVHFREDVYERDPRVLRALGNAATLGTRSAFEQCV
jgi:L,D-transpeptidase YcbB